MRRLARRRRGVVRTEFPGGRMTEKEHAANEKRRVDVSASEFKALFEAVTNWGRWGEDDERGTLNELSADRIVAAANLVRSGVTVTLSLPWNTQPRIDNPKLAVHRMTLLHDVGIGSATSTSVPERSASPRTTSASITTTTPTPTSTRSAMSRSTGTSTTASRAPLSPGKAPR
jgi:hypothetical protein